MIRRILLSFTFVFLVTAMSVAVIAPDAATQKSLIPVDDASAAGQRAANRKIIVEVAVAEPAPGFVQNITVALTYEQGGNNLSIVPSGSAELRRNGDLFTREYDVPDTVRAMINGALTIKTNDSTNPTYLLPAQAMDFTRADSLDFKIARNLRFVPVHIEAVERVTESNGHTTDRPVDAHVRIRRRVQDAYVNIAIAGPASFAGGVANTYLPADPFFLPIGTQLEVEGMLSTQQGFNLYSMSRVTIPDVGGLITVRLVFLNWERQVRAELFDVLERAGIEQETARTIRLVMLLPDPGVPFAEWRPNKRYYIAYIWEGAYYIGMSPSFNPMEPNGGDSLMHEWTHETLYRTGWNAPDPPNTGHNCGQPASVETLAYEEGLAHFLGSHLLTRILQKNTVLGHTTAPCWLDNPADRLRVLALQFRNQANANNPARGVMQNPGSWIEGIWAGALIEMFNEMGLNPEQQPDEVLRSMIADLRAFCAATAGKERTPENFFIYRRQNVRNRIPQFEGRVIDQIALWYLISERSKIQQIDHLVPVNLTVEGATSVAANVPVTLKVSARAFHRLADSTSYPKIRVRLFEGATKVGNDIPLDPDASTPAYNFVARPRPSWPTAGTHSLRAEIWGDFIDGKMEKLGETAELTIDIGKATTDLSTQAQAKYQWLKDASPYLKELLELDERTFNELEKAVHKEILKRVAEGRYPPLTPADHKRIEQLEKELPKTLLVQERVKDPLTGEEALAFVEKGAKPSSADLQKGIELAKLKARTSPEAAVTHYELECTGGETELHLQRQRELKNKISLLEESTPYRNFQEYANLRDFQNYLNAVQTLNKQLNLPAPIPHPVVLPWVYSAPCASVSAPASSALSVLLKANPNPVKPNAIANITATVSGGTRPYKYAWTGDAKGQDANATFSNQKAGEYQISLTVTDSVGRTSTADAKMRVTAMQVKLEMTPANPKIAFGTSRALKATLSSDGQEVTGSYAYRWENKQDVKFGEDETKTNQTSAIFQKPGKQTLWVSVLTEANGIYSTVAPDSEPIEVFVDAPLMSIAFNPPSPLIGQETKATLILQGNVPKDAIDFRWLLPDNAKPTGESADGREVTFIPQSDAVLTFTVTAREPVVGTEFGRATATLKVNPFNVTAVVVGVTGKPSPDVALVNKPGAIAVNQEISVRASITPQPAKPPVKFVWSVTRDGANEIVGSNVGSEVVISRSQTGVCEISVEAFDANNTRLGKSAASFDVSVSAAEIEAAKRAKLSKEKLEEAKAIIRKGKFKEAVILLEETVSLDAKNTEASTLLQKTKNEIATINAQLEKYRNFAKEYRFREAQAELIVAQNINGVYQPVAEAVVELRDLWWKYDGAVKERLGAMQIANENRQFKKTLELADQTRAELKLFELSLQNFNRMEQRAQTHEAEKERQRSIMKRGEEKLRNYDFVGAYQDFNVMRANNDFAEYWNSNYDPEPPIYDKLRSDTYSKMENIKVLLSNATNVANDASFTAPIVEKAVKDCDEILKIQPPNAEAKRLRDALAERLRKMKSPVNSLPAPPPLITGPPPTRTPVVNPSNIGEDRLSAGALDKKAITRPKPEYPPAAVARATGTVEVEILVDEQGNVESAQAVSGHPLLRAAAEQAALQAKFRPYLKNGRAVKVKGTLTYDFNPEGPTPTETPTNPAASDVPGLVRSEDGRLHPANGYEWVNPNDPKDLRVQLKPGLVKKEDGKVHPANGYEWVNPNDPKDLRVKKNDVPSPSTKPPGSSEVDLFNSINVYGVGNQPTTAATFAISRAHMVTYLFTYHWNNGSGSTRAGTISLRRSDGTVYGPWATIGSPGQGGVPNASWEAHPNVVIPAGTYTIVDSSPGTWAQNGESGGRGHAVVKGYPSGSTVSQQPTPTQTFQPTPFIGCWKSGENGAYSLYIAVLDGELRGKIRHSNLGGKEDPQMLVDIKVEGNKITGKWASDTQFKWCPNCDGKKRKGVFTLTRNGDQLNGTASEGSDSEMTEWRGTVWPWNWIRTSDTKMCAAP